jgi:hypothetical protein
MPTPLEQQIMTKVRVLAFVRRFFFPHARKTYALLLSIFASMHYISYAAIMHNIAPYGLMEKVQYLFGAVLNTKMVTLFVLLAISYFAISLAFDLLRGLRPKASHTMQHA